VRMERSSQTFMREIEEYKLFEKQNSSMRKFKNDEIKKINEIMLNFQPAQKTKVISSGENYSDFMKKKLKREHEENTERNHKKQKFDTEKDIDPHFYFDMDNQNKFADDLNVNLLKYNLDYSGNNRTSNLNSNNMRNENINNIIGINFTSSNHGNVRNSYNNFEYNFNQNSLDKNLENEIIKNIVLDRINIILSGDSLIEKIMLYMIITKSENVSRVENGIKNEMEKLFDNIKANFSEDEFSHFIQADVVKKILFGFCKYLEDQKYSILQRHDESDSSSRDLCGEESKNRNSRKDVSDRSNSSGTNTNSNVKNDVKIFFLFLLGC
jgi:hypothetical protein